MDIATDKQVEHVIQAVAEEMISLSTDPNTKPEVVLSQVQPEKLDNQESFPSQGFLLQGFLNHIVIKNFYLLLRFREDSNELRVWLYKKAAELYQESIDKFLLYADRNEKIDRLRRIYSDPRVIQSMVREPMPDPHFLFIPRNIQDACDEIYQKRIEHDPVKFSLQCLNQGSYGRILGTVSIGYDTKVLGDIWLDQDPSVKDVAKEILKIFPPVATDVIGKMPFLSKKDMPKLKKGQDDDFIMDAMYFGHKIQI